MDINKLKDTYKFIIDDKGRFSDNSIVLNGKKMNNKQKTLLEIYESLKFNEYMSHANLDGLFELLQPDLWEGSSLRIRIDDSEYFLKNNDPQFLTSLFDLFNEIYQMWSKGKSQESFSLEMN